MAINSEITIIVLTMVLCTIALITTYVYIQKNDDKINIQTNTYLGKNKIKNNIEISGDTCTTICDSLDPVSDPKYNMQQIIKQSILLEEHLTNKNKRCRDCITKHFLHIIGLAEEAQMLATNKIDNYPYINESVILYNDLFKVWIENKRMNGKDESYILYCTNKLRDHRKELIVLYFFNEKYKIKKNDDDVK